MHTTQRLAASDSQVALPKESHGAMESSNEVREAINAWASVLIDIYEKLKKRRQPKPDDAEKESQQIDGE